MRGGFLILTSTFFSTERVLQILGTFNNDLFISVDFCGRNCVNQVSHRAASGHARFTQFLPQKSTSLSIHMILGKDKNSIYCLRCNSIKHYPRRTRHQLQFYVQSWPKKCVLGCVISPLRQQAESRNLGHTFLANSVHLPNVVIQLFPAQSEGRDLKKRLRTAEDDLKRSQTDTTRFFSTLKARTIYLYLHLLIYCVD